MVGLTIGEIISTAYTESDLYKVTRKNYRLRRMIRTRDSVTGKEVNLALPKGEYKRDYLGFCEVCGQIIPEDKHKGYHHWDDEMPAMGVWVCYKCHKVIEGVDSGISERYLSLKTEIERVYAIEQLKKVGVTVGDDWGR